MADSNNPAPGVPRPRGTAEVRSNTPGSETILLSEMPETSSPAPEAAIDSRSPFALSTNVLAALGQRYEILAEAGHGSMGNVYKARDRETGETVALKLLKPEIASDQAMMDRFKNELLYARKITHKNVCRVYEFNRIGGIAYTSMEFVEGESLRSVLNRFGALTQKKATDLGLQICSGLKEAHAQGIVHRDLKPENVMIDTNGNLKLMDFGIARSMEAVTRQTGAMVGTPAYMAPEQVAGSPVDYRTDIYALGLMLYEMFTGKPAFSAENAIAVALKQMREEVTPPHDIDPSIQPAIERVILKCLEKSPAKRFQSVVELETALRSQPPSATNAGPSVAPAVARSASPAVFGAGLAPARAARSSSKVIWSVLASFLLLGAMGAAGWYWRTTMQAAEQITPPAARPAPPPPDFAYEIPVTTPSAPDDDAEKSTAAKTVAPKPVAPAPARTLAESHTKAAAPDVFPKMEVGPERRKLPDPSKWIAAQKAAQQQGKLSGKVYLRTGRFAKEQKAEADAKRIRALGLPAIVKTRQGATGTLYVTMCGPIAAGGAKAVADQLKAVGFTDVEKVSAAAVQ